MNNNYSLSKTNTSYIALQDAMEHLEFPVLLQLIYFIFCLVNTVLHCFCSYLLVYMYRYMTDTPQQLLLINHSVSEIMKNLLLMMYNPVLTKMLQTAQARVVLVRFQEHVYLSLTVIVYMHYTSMLYLTLDRLLEIRLNLKYHLYVNIKKVKYLLTCTWLVGLMTCIMLSIMYELKSFISIHPYSFYVVAALSFVFLIIAITTYVYIFKKFKDSHKPPVSTALSNSNIIHLSTFQLFQQSCFTYQLF